MARTQQPQKPPAEAPNGASPPQRLTVELPMEQMRQLQERADRLGVSVEDLVRLSIGDLLRGPDAAFARAVDYVLDENAELYRRLA